MMRILIGTAAALLALPLGAQEDEVKTEEIEYRDGDVVLQGYAAWNPKAGATLPGVLIVHEWWGHGEYVKMRARELAKLGYHAFALDMYGKGVFAKDHEEAAKLMGNFKDPAAARSRAKAGLDALLKRPVDPKRIAAMGYCFGGRVALEMARAGFDLRGVASFHGLLGAKDPAEAKNIKGKVIVFHGASDSFVPAEEVAAFHKEMTEAKVDYQFVAFGHAVHSFTIPTAGSDPSKGVAYDEKADRRSWGMLKDYLGECLR